MKKILIPPERAGYRGSAHIPLVYAEFEKLRQRKNALTYDDFIPLAVGILEHERAISEAWCGQANHIVVDEYQDINYGQQRLIELLAGDRADVMVVGDDDQTIYEWRGARPSYMIREFRTVFANKPHTDYALSRSFRFGPVIAQCAYNAITMNTTRVKKSLIAHQASKLAEVHVVESLDADRELANQVIGLVKGQDVPPAEIRVLVRTFPLPSSPAWKPSFWRWASRIASWDAHPSLSGGRTGCCWTMSVSPWRSTTQPPGRWRIGCFPSPTRPAAS